MDHTTAAGFRAAMPCDDERQTNVMRGVLPGGEYGVLCNEGLNVGWDQTGSDWGGEFHHVRITSGATKPRLRDVAKSMLNPLGASAPMLPARVPATLAGIRVPEAAGYQSFLRIDQRLSATPHSFVNRTKLDDLIGPYGWSVFCEPKPEPETVASLVAEPVASLLKAHARDGLFQMVYWFGTLLVRRNGYASNPADLDALCDAAALVAQRLRELNPLSPQPFATELPAPAWRGGGTPVVGFNPFNEWRQWGDETAKRFGMTLEEPHDYHRAFPSVPVPGVAMVVMRGELPRLGHGRLVVHRERDSARLAVVLAAPEGTAPTPPGGTVFRDHGARLEVTDGLRAVWNGTSYWGNAMAGDVDAFLASAAAILGA